MTSINTNVSALSALRNLSNTQTKLQETQERVSTGLKIRSSKDDPSGFAIAQNIRGQVRSLGTITEAISLAKATLATAVAATKTINGLMDDIKANIVKAQNDNVDRSAIQADINELVAQIDSQVQTAAFNGSNLLDGGTDPFNILIGITKVGGVEAPDFISFNRFDLRSTGATTNSQLTETFDNTTSDSSLFLKEDFVPGDVNNVALDLRDTSVNPAVAVSLDVAIAAGDDLDAVATKVQAAIRAVGTGDFGTVNVVADDAAGKELVFSNAAGKQIAFEHGAFAFTGGGLAELASLDVTTTTRATSALSTIDGLTDVVRDTNQSLGSRQRRLDLQETFIGTLTDSLETGLGAIVNADLAKESVNLSAQQVKQDLGIQALGIANQNPRALLQLFSN